MENHQQIVLSSIENFASVNICGCGQCNSDVLHINYGNTTLRLTRRQCRRYVNMLNEALLSLDMDGEYRKNLEGLCLYHKYTQEAEQHSE
jgi:hypothetical protein